MSSYASLYAGGKEILTYRNEVNTDLFYLFNNDELKRLKGDEAATRLEGRYVSINGDEIDDIEGSVFESTTEKLKDRLNILGINTDTVKRVYEDCKQHQIEYLESEHPGDSAYIRELKHEATALKSQSFNDWQKHLHEYLIGLDDAKDTEGTYVRAPVGVMSGVDERIILMAVLELLPGDEVIELDVTALVDEGWTNEEVVEMMGDVDLTYSMPSMPPIILTEGVYDSKVLKESIKLLHPDLVKYFRFLDTDFRPEGGAAAVVKLLKSFAAAGISNRILAVFDNDTAAHEALTALRGFKLPSNYKVITYPNIKKAEDYPTIGPQGAVEMNVNGLAGSIELYLGNDCLFLDDAKLMPVQWTGYSHKMKSYQGEVTDKQLVQKLFQQKLKTAHQNPEFIQSQDWEDVEAIIQTIIKELGNL